MDLSATHALIRFGLGRRGDEPLPADPRAWLAAQLGPPSPPTPGLPTTADGLSALLLERDLRKARRDAGLPAKPDPEAPHPVQDLHRLDLADFVTTALTTQTPFRERLAWFWMNHFTVSLRQGRCGALAGAFLREAIRPYVTGRFADMHLAVMRHPAMLFYLDNDASAGPASPANRNGRRGLNENLARECLELHTVGARAGYTQADVTALAAVLTGWSVELHDPPPGFRFRPAFHEPGVQTVMGHACPEGEAGGTEILTWLATHPATYHHLATKLACHFVADSPSPTDIATIERALADTGGDLGAASHALIGLRAAWQPLTKLRTPQDLVIAALRAADPPPDALATLARPVAAALGSLGQPLWTAPLPNGWPDRAEDWSGPEAMLARIDWAYRFAGAESALDPDAAAERVLGPLLRPQTREQMAHAGSRRDSLTLLVASPEFQRR